MLPSQSSYRGGYLLTRHETGGLPKKAVHRIGCDLYRNLLPIVYGLHIVIPSLRGPLHVQLCLLPQSSELVQYQGKDAPLLLLYEGHTVLLPVINSWQILVLLLENDGADANIICSDQGWVKGGEIKQTYSLFLEVGPMLCIQHKGPLVPSTGLVAVTPVGNHVAQLLGLLQDL